VQRGSLLPVFDCHRVHGWAGAIFAACAASFARLGEVTWTTQYPFVVAGVQAPLVQVLLLREEFLRHPAVWNFALVVFGPAPIFLLNVWQCRYKARAILFFAAGVLRFKEDDMLTLTLHVVPSMGTGHVSFEG